MSGTAGAIDLAKETAFALGPVRAEPAALALFCPDGRQFHVQHRVMQVLVFLYQRGGETVARDELNLHCWEGRAVGSDVIDRALLLLRRALQASGAPARVETIPRVGVRLLCEEIAGPPAHQPGKVLLAIPSFTALSGAAEAPFIAEAITEAVQEALAHRQRMSIVVGSAAPAPLRLDGTVQSVGGRTRVFVRLIRTSDSVQLWAEHYDGSTDDPFELEDRIAAAVADAVQQTLSERATEI